ncbi:hypothetical protein [Caminibacter sp.]
MRFVLILLTLIFLGCGGSKYFYWDVNLSVKNSYKKNVAVKITLPDYLKSGYIIGLKGEKFLYLNYQIPETAEKFYGDYLIKKLRNLGINAKLYPWAYNYKPKKVYKIKISDYYVDLRKKEVVLKIECCKEKFVFIQPYKNDYLKAYKEVYDKMIKKIEGVI